MVDIYSPTRQDPISPQELELYHLIMDYRAGLGLPAVPLSAALSATAGRHTLDTVDNILATGLRLPVGANLHSWSDAFYYADHRDPGAMWNAPTRLGLSYPSEGYEITAAGQENIRLALDGWKASRTHNEVITNTGIWAAADWQAIGVGVEMREDTSLEFAGRVFHVWFGTSPDPSGPPVIRGEDGADALTGTGFADLFYGRTGDDSIAGGAGNDTLGGGGGNDNLSGGAGADLLWTAAGDDIASGGWGNDTLGGARGNDNLSGDGGQDALWGSVGNDTLAGGVGDDTLGGFDGRDSLLGEDGADELWGAADDDTLDGGNGNDQLGGGTGHDSVTGGAGHDTVSGGLGDDTVLGGYGDDLIFGAGGDDRLAGGPGADTIWAGPGADTIVHGAGDGADLVEAFAVAEDRLELDDALWLAGHGALSAARVVAQFGADAGADYVLDFGDGDSITLAGMAGITGLESQIDIV